MKFKKIIFSAKIKLLSLLICFLPLSTLFLMFINSGCQPLDVRKTALATPSEAEFFKSKCSKCHDPELAMKEYRTAEVWRDTIARMKEEHNAEITPEEIKRLTKYHVERQKQEAAIFKEKCQKCHPGRVFLEKSLTPDQARATIKRMQQKAGNTIEDKDIEIIVRYHVQSHKAALEESIKGAFSQVAEIKPGMKNKGDPNAGVSLFLAKCSSCHEPSRALSVIKDPDVWAQTIKRMQYYSKGEITDQEANRLVDFHVTEQQREINAFKETCTKCHSDERINSRSMSEEQWLATIKRMQQKAPDLISDEKITLLAAYFHRRELAMARIFYGKCQLCHIGGSGVTASRGSTMQLNGLIVLANEEFGESLRLIDVNNLLSFHVQRQKRNMRLYENDCAACHIGGIPEKKKPDEEAPKERSREEWISFIATLQGIGINRDIQNTINSQIDYHKSGF